MDPVLSRRALLLGSLACMGAGAAPGMVAIEIANGRCVVPVRLDGRAARMVLDTGAERSIITHEAATRLGLRRDLWVQTTMRGAGGQLETRPNADVGAVMLGGTKLSQMLPGGAFSLSVTELDLGDADGLLGGDVLRHYTVDLDVPRASLWLRPADVLPAGNLVPLQLWARDLLLAPVQIDGVALTALVDTGATTTLINARGLYRLGLTPAQLGHDPAAVQMGIGGAFAARLHPFEALRFGPLVLPQPRLLAVGVPEAAYDVTLGLDVLGRRRLVLSYAGLTLSIGSA